MILSCDMIFLFQDFNERQTEVLLKNEVPQEDCSYIIEVPPMVASSSDDESMIDGGLLRGNSTVVELHHEQLGLSSPLGAKGISTPERGSKESGLSEMVFYDTETSVENELHLAHSSRGRKFRDENRNSKNSGSSVDFGSSKMMEKQKSTSAESLPPSRYDYPAFLTIPRSRKDRASPRQNSDFDDVMETSTDDVSHGHEVPHILSSSSEELLSFESESSVKPMLPVAVGRLENLGPHQPVNPVPECFDDELEAPGPSYRGSSLRESSSFLRTPRMITRRYSSGDDKPRCQQRTRRYNSASSSSPADYEDGLYLVSSREQEYIRKHTIRNENRRDSSMTENGEGSGSHYHSTADVYVSLLNIIQQSQSLITDLTLHYQAEMTFPGTGQTTPTRPVPSHNDSSPSYGDSFASGNVNVNVNHRLREGRALEATVNANITSNTDSVLRNYEYPGQSIMPLGHSRGQINMTPAAVRGAEGGAIGGRPAGPGWTSHNYWAPGNPGTSYDVKESFV